MRNPIRVTREKVISIKEGVTEIYHADKGYYDFCAGSIATSLTVIGTMKFLQAQGIGPFKVIELLEIDTNQTAEQIAEIVLEHKAFDLVNPETGKRIAVYAADFVEGVIE